MIIKYYCEVCNKEFYDEWECAEHEAMHTLSKLSCDKCGRKYPLNKKHNFILQNMYHEVNLGNLGYGSKLDGCNVEFILCDDCLYNFVNTFLNKDKILGGVDCVQR